MPSIPAAVYWIVFLLPNTYHSCFWHLPEVIDYREILTSGNMVNLVVPTSTDTISYDTKGRVSITFDLKLGNCPTWHSQLISGLKFGVCNSHMQSCAT